MKIQCSCGTKYSFDVTPEMARAPIRFVCQPCGRDSSDVVNQLVRQELGTVAPPAIARVDVTPPVAAEKLVESAPSPRPSPAGEGVKILSGLAKRPSAH